MARLKFQIKPVSNQFNEISSVIILNHISVLNVKKKRCGRNAYYTSCSNFKPSNLYLYLRSFKVGLYVYRSPKRFTRKNTRVMFHRQVL